jgi:hypothetical protein
MIFNWFLKMFDYEGNQGTIGQEEDNLETKYETSQLNRRTGLYLVKVP